MNIDFICIVSFHGVLVKESAFLRKCAIEKKKINDYKVKVTTVCSLFFSFLLKKKTVNCTIKEANNPDTESCTVDLLNSDFQ